MARPNTVEGNSRVNDRAKDPRTCDIQGEDALHIHQRKAKSITASFHLGVTQHDHSPQISHSSKPSTFHDTTLLSLAQLKHTKLKYGTVRHNLALLIVLLGLKNINSQ